MDDVDTRVLCRCQDSVREEFTGFGEIGPLVMDPKVQSAADDHIGNCGAEFDVGAPGSTSMAWKLVITEDNVILEPADGADASTSGAAADATASAAAAGAGAGAGADAASDAGAAADHPPSAVLQAFSVEASGVKVCLDVRCREKALPRAACFTAWPPTPVSARRLNSTQPSRKCSACWCLPSC